MQSLLKAFLFSPTLILLASCATTPSQMTAMQIECSKTQSGLVHLNECLHVSGFQNANGQCSMGYSVCR